MTSVEAFQLLSQSVSAYGSAIAILGKNIQLAFARSAGKNHTAEKLKELQRGMVIFHNVMDEVSQVSPLEMKPTTKAFKPKRKRIKDIEPFYIKFEKRRRR